MMTQNLQPEHPIVVPEKRRQQLIAAICRQFKAVAQAAAADGVYATIYGKATDFSNVLAIDYSSHTGAASLNIPIAGHTCDVMFVTRYDDPRIIVFLPRSLIDVLRQGAASNPMALLGVEQGATDPLDAVLTRGFDAYSKLHEVDVLYQVMEHGVVMHFCFGGAVRVLLNDYLFGRHTPINFVSDALAQAALHILQTIAAFVARQVAHNAEATGRRDRIEFESRMTSADMVRIYQIDPAALRVIKEASDNETGHYALLLGPKIDAAMKVFLKEVIEDGAGHSRAS